MSIEQNISGAAVVGNLPALTPWQALLVKHLRLWCEGPKGQDVVLRDWAQVANAADSSVALDQFNALVVTLQAYARRPLVRHASDCTCFGADEAVCMQIVADASDGHLDDAVMLAGFIAWPAHAERIAILAGQVGAAFRATQLPKHSARPSNTSKLYPTLH